MAKKQKKTTLKPADLIAPLGGKPGTRQPNPTIRNVRFGLKSNVGHPSARRTLWIFGAGASLHLGFPLSYNFFAESIRLLTSRFKDANKFTAIFGDSTKSNGKPAVLADFKKIKKDPVFALQEVGLWGYFQLNQGDSAIFQYLLNEWKRLADLLRVSGLTLSAKEILDRNPENLIDEIRKLPVIKSKRSYAAKSRDDAIKCLQSIYFFTLSHFNDAARREIVAGKKSLYENFVKSISIEGQQRVISFNYDTILDESFFQHFTKSWAFAGVELAGINGHPVAAGPRADVSLIKPHGSLNLMRCNNCSRVHLQWFRSYVPTGVGQQSAHNRRCVYCTQATAGRPELMSALVIPPLYDKQAIDQSKKAIRSAFAWADNIVAVGFSFPAQDAYFIKCMAKGLRRNPHGTVTVHIVGRDKAGAKATKAQLLSNPLLRPIKKQLRIVAVDADGFEGMQIGGHNFNVPQPKSVKHTKAVKR